VCHTITYYIAIMKWPLDNFMLTTGKLEPKLYILEQERVTKFAYTIF